MNPQSQSWLSANIKCLLSIIVLTFVFAYFFVCLLSSVKPDPQILIGLLNLLMLVLGYWFGSSSGSSKKDDGMIANLGNPTVTGDSPTVNLTKSTEQPINKVE